MNDTVPAYKRILLKISGEAVAPPGGRGIAMDSVVRIAEQVRDSVALGVQMAIVLGGGNILRGAQFSSQASHIHEATAHYMGMLATVMNALAFQDALESLGCSTRVMTAIRMDGVAEPYIRRRAQRHLEKGRVIILAAGTGSPFVTTDTAAAQRALELNADVLLKATRVEGVYSSDPEKDPEALFYSHISYDELLSRHLKIMDQGAVAKCLEYNLPIRVFNYRSEGNIVAAVRGLDIGTLISN
ncbi:MAG: UMP kinase [Planctomycetia bacterium]|nr:UMP kinase [Planctomycetia bacterium]